MRSGQAYFCWRSQTGPFAWFTFLICFLVVFFGISRPCWAQGVGWSSSAAPVLSYRSSLVSTPPVAHRPIIQRNAAIGSADKTPAPQSLPPMETSGHAGGGYEQKPISVTVSKAQYLPPAMYGQWSVTGDMVESNSPEQFSPKLSDIWILEREGDQVVISNPATGASATISVDKVEGDTATFHRMGQEDRRQVLEEIPTITVRNDVMTGVMLNRVLKIKNGVLVPVAYVKYQLAARRIGGARTRFMPSEGGVVPELEPDIQIDDMKFAPGKKRPFQY
jgi:hypothetical protein